MSTPDFNQFKRDENGLLPNVNYVYTTDGRIDWRKMVESKYLVVRRGKEGEVVAKYGKEISDLNLTEVDDKYLLILLDGLKKLARIRGYHSAIPQVHAVDDNKATVSYIIKYFGNYETGGQPVEFGDVGSASLNSTESFAKNFLESIAANRAFCRAVRNFLGIEVLAKDEIASSVESEDVSPNLGVALNAAMTLSTKAQEKKISFAKIKDGALNKYRAEIAGDPATWKDFADIQPVDCWTLLGKLEKIK